jgi:hypothetical protein
MDAVEGFLNAAVSFGRAARRQTEVQRHFSVAVKQERLPARRVSRVCVLAQRQRYIHSRRRFSKRKKARFDAAVPAAPADDAYNSAFATTRF